MADIRTDAPTASAGPRAHDAGDGAAVPFSGFIVHALAVEPFAPLFALDDAALAARGARRVVADGRPAYPCRVSLRDADEGERLVLLPYAHHAVDGPYRASGPIYVREAAARARPARGEVPGLLRRRLLSLRGYGADGAMTGAEALPGTDLEAGLARRFDVAGTACVHVHYAQPGCYACRVERA